MGAPPVTFFSLPPPTLGLPMAEIRLLKDFGICCVLQKGWDLGPVSSRMVSMVLGEALALLP